MRLEQAAADLNRQHDGQVREFMVGADIAGRRHHWVLGSPGGGALQPEQASTLLDEHLRSSNAADYDTFRQQSRINPPYVQLVSEQQIYDWSAEVRGKLWPEQDPLYRPDPDRRAGGKPGWFYRMQ